MKKTPHPKPRTLNPILGFTLIEILIYSAIVTAVLSLSVLAAYQLINSSERVVDRRQLTENQKFLLQKIIWTLKDVSSINEPVFGGSGGTLSVNKLNYAFNPLIISLNNGVVELTSGATTSPITNRYVTVDNLSFEYLNFSTSTILRISADISNKTASSSMATTIVVE